MGDHFFQFNYDPDQHCDEGKFFYLSSIWQVYDGDDKIYYLYVQHFQFSLFTIITTFLWDSFGNILQGLKAIGI